MARPKKQTADYFPHYVTANSRTLFILENKYGNDGYAFWFKLLEILGSTNGHSFNTQEQTDLLFLSAKVKMDDEKVIEILDLLASLGAIDTELWNEHKVIWCQNFVDNLGDLYAKRKVSAPKKPTFESFGHLKPQLSGVSDTVNPQSIVKDSRVNKRIVEDNKEKETDVVVINPLSEIVTVYENEIGLISPVVSDCINYYLQEGLEVALIIKAIHLAVKNNAKRLNYIEGIINNWIKDGVKTLNQQEAKEKERENNKAAGLTPKGVLVVKPTKFNTMITSNFDYDKLEQLEDGYIDQKLKELNGQAPP